MRKVLHAENIHLPFNGRVRYLAHAFIQRRAESTIKRRSRAH